VGAIGFVLYFMDTVYEVDVAVPPEDVPQAVIDQFQQRFPGMAAKTWELDEDMYEAELRWKEGERVEAASHPDGTWARSVFVIPQAGLPPKARIYLKQKKRYRVVEVERIEHSGGAVEYMAELSSTLRKWECRFDQEGNLVEREREGPVLEGPPDD
jgi:hypothetical protein